MTAISLDTQGLVDEARMSFRVFEKDVIAQRGDRIEELVAHIEERYAPYVEDHPKADHFRSLLDAEIRAYETEATITMEWNFTELDNHNKYVAKLHRLFLLQLEIANDDLRRQQLESILQAERYVAMHARTRLVTFGVDIKQLMLQIDQSADEEEARSCAVKILSTIREERTHMMSYLP